MKKRVFLLLLAAAMLLALAACGGGRNLRNDERYDSDSEIIDSIAAAMNAPVTDELGFLTIQKSVFETGETIVVTTNNITQEMYDDDAFVAIYILDAEHDEYKQYEYPQEGTDTLRFTAPYWAGAFEFRLYSMDYVYTDDTFVTSLRFYVIDKEIDDVIDNGIAALLEPTSDELGYLTIQKSIFRINETIIVSTGGITQEMYDNNSFVAIYSSGAAHSDYMQYEYPQAGSDSLYFSAPFWTGAFEMRLYSMDHVYTDDTFVTSVNFLVIDDSYCPDCFELLENCICADDVNGGQGVTPPPVGTTTPPPDGVTPPPDGVTPPPNGTPVSAEAAGFLGRFSFVEDGVNHGAMFNLYFRADGTGIFNWLVLPNTHIDWSVVGENRISISYQSVSEYMTIYGTLDGDTLNVVDPYFPDNLYVFIRD
jgi:hypothetical protein